MNVNVDHNSNKRCKNPNDLPPSTLNYFFLPCSDFWWIWNDESEASFSQIVAFPLRIFRIKVSKFNHQTSERWVKNKVFFIAAVLTRRRRIEADENDTIKKLTLKKSFRCSVGHFFGCFFCGCFYWQIFIFIDILIWLHGSKNITYYINRSHYQYSQLRSVQ